MYFKSKRDLLERIKKGEILYPPHFDVKEEHSGAATDYWCEECMLRLYGEEGKREIQRNCQREAVKILLNAEGTLNDVSKELKAFLDYVAGKKSEDSYVEKLDEAVREAKKNREWRHEYMTLLMRGQENRETGREQGEEMMAKLIMLLNEDGRLSDIIKVSQDKEYRQKLYVEYHIV